MFTGIVTDVGEIVSLTPTAQGQLHRLRIACRYDRAGIADGASIACNGVCLTVVGSGVEQGRTWFDVDAAAETLGMTTARYWGAGTRLNLERALKIGDELGGISWRGMPTASPPSYRATICPIWRGSCYAPRGSSRVSSRRRARSRWTAYPDREHRG